ncbi:MAG: hypothetical protein ACE5HE_08795 [Phycisphaerae bacterium]
MIELDRAGRIRHLDGSFDELPDGASANNVIGTTEACQLAGISYAQLHRAMLAWRRTGGAVGVRAFRRGKRWALIRGDVEHYARTRPRRDKQGEGR